ncbi:MAG: ATP-binding cassette domain-containing protein [Myxococcales bacterium]|nr:ATP-binding cassette domain-containing protein [Myxococcales bacterium]
MEHSSIRLDNVRAGYGDELALDGMSCELLVDRTTVIIGPGGSGKSTVLKLIAGPSARPSSGLWCTGEITRPSADIAVVGQRAHGGEALASTVARIDANAVVETWREAPREFVEGLLRGLDRDPSDMSPETQRLLELTAALVSRHPVLLLDEPSNGLCARARAALQQLLVRARGTRTIVVVSHDLAFTRAIADDVVFLLDGSIVESGTAEKIFENPTRERTRAMVRWGA